MNLRKFQIRNTSGRVLDAGNHGRDRFTTPRTLQQNTAVGFYGKLRKGG